jgi:hypothetical protein
MQVKNASGHLSIQRFSFLLAGPTGVKCLFEEKICIFIPDTSLIIVVTATAPQFYVSFS